MKRDTAKAVINGVIAVALVAVGVTVGRIDINQKEPTKYVYDEVTVAQGDTLWEICSEYCPDNMDIRKYIHDIERINGITDSRIFPNQKITIYAERK